MAQEGDRTVKQRNCTIDCLKFLFAWVVVLFHFYGPTHKHFIGGFIAVEYFLLVASVFVYEKHEKMENDILVSGGRYIDNYIVSRFKRIFPWSASALLFAEIVIRIILPQNLSLGHILDNLTYDFSEMLLLKMNGIATTSAALLNGPSWTISSMLLVEFLLWYCLSQHKKLFTDLIAPISIIVGLGIWAHVEDTQVKTWMGITTFGTFRTWVVYCEGYYCWQLSKKMRSLKLNKCGEMLFLVYLCFSHLGYNEPSNKILSVGSNLFICNCNRHFFVEPQFVESVAKQI